MRATIAFKGTGMGDGSGFDDSELATIRRAYARQMLALAEVAANPALEAAFAAVPREAFLGPPPWFRVGIRGDYRPLPADPAVLYQDLVVALTPQKGINNGSPSLHAAWLHRAGLKPGDRVAHIGCGSGYYTAVIAHLVGDAGRVLAVEFDPALAATAADNLARFANVAAIAGDGALWPDAAVDCVYVNFAATRPADAWLAHLKPGGRLIFPLGVRRPQPSLGGVQTLHAAGMRIERRADGFAAEALGPVSFVCAEGALAEAAENDALRAAFAGGGIESVRSLRWNRPALPGRSWFVGSGWSLGYDPPDRA